MRFLRREQEASAAEERIVLLMHLLNESKQGIFTLPTDIFTDILGQGCLDWLYEGVRIGDGNIIVDEFDKDSRWCRVGSKGILLTGRIDKSNRLDYTGEDFADD